MSLDLDQGWTIVLFIDTLDSFVKSKDGEEDYFQNKQGNFLLLFSVQLRHSSKQSCF